MAFHNDIGAYGEQIVNAHLAQVAPVKPGRRADLCFAEKVEIEVKTSLATLYNGRTHGYQFLVRSPGHSDFHKADVLVLICLDGNLDPVATYVLPTGMLRNRKKITIPASLRTPFDVFRDRWEIIADEYVRR